MNQSDIDKMWSALDEANEDACWQRNSGDGRPSLEVIDALTDAVSALLSVRRAKLWARKHRESERKGEDVT
jgi:hypothetical protein